MLVKVLAENRNVFIFNEASSIDINPRGIKINSWSENDVFLNVVKIGQDSRVEVYNSKENCLYSGTLPILWPDGTEFDFEVEKAVQQIRDITKNENSDTFVEKVMDTEEEGEESAFLWL